MEKEDRSEAAGHDPIDDGVITPTVGRVVHYYPSPARDPQCALIASVHNERCVNLAIFDGNGNPVTDPPRMVPLIQPNDENPDGGFFCCWMPYQVKKAHGSESGERRAGQEAI